MSEDYTIRNINITHALFTKMHSYEEDFKYFLTHSLLTLILIYSILCELNWRMNRHQQNKCYPQWCLLAHFEGTLDFSRSEFTCP